jgi:glyceraldehyde 3-phosphate dehydrogenase
VPLRQSSKSFPNLPGSSTVSRFYEVIQYHVFPVAEPPSGISIRVPVTNVSLVDLTVTLSTPVPNKEALIAPFRLAAQRSPSRSTSEAAPSPVPSLAGVMAVSDEKLVSSDYLSALQSSIVDADASVMLNQTTAKIVAWYDNEVGFASRSE